MHKTYDTVWRNGLWKQLVSKYGINGKTWRILKTMTACTNRAVMLQWKLSEFFNILAGGPYKDIRYHQILLYVFHQQYPESRRGSTARDTTRRESSIWKIVCRSKWSSDGICSVTETLS